MISQASIAAQVAIVVFRNVTPVSPWNCAENAAGSASESAVKTIEPTLKPYQPNHRRPAPIMVSVRLCGFIGSFMKPTRLPMTSASTRPATPALMWTTVPPA